MDFVLMQRYIFYFLFVNIKFISCGLSFTWSTEEKPNSKTFSFTGIENIYYCSPFESENCAKVTEIQIANNNTFDCQDQNIAVLMNILDLKITVVPSTPDQPCAYKREKRIWVFGYLTLNSGLYTNQQIKSENCPRIKRYYISKDESLILFDDSIALVETKKINNFISVKFLKSFSFFSYLLFNIYCYDEKTDEAEFKKIILIFMVIVLVIFRTVILKIYAIFKKIIKDELVIELNEEQKKKKEKGESEETNEKKEESDFRSTKKYIKKKN